MSATARYAVFGHPVSHSLSPQIHAEFARQFGITLDYSAIDAHPERFQDTLALFADSGGRGANVTLPLKQIAHTLATSLSPYAERTGAVNTLIRKGNGWHGDNTDGQGLICDLTKRHGLTLRGRRTLLLGAGGAARGIAPALLEAGIARLSIVNRTTARSQALAETLGEPERVHPHPADRLAELGECDLIINATSAARDDIPSFPLPSLPRTLMTSQCAAVDLNYGKAAIPFIRWAQVNNIQVTLDGLGMLVEQAAESFQLWHGQRPDTHPVYTHLRQQTVILPSTN